MEQKKEEKNEERKISSEWKKELKKDSSNERKNKKERPKVRYEWKKKWTKERKKKWEKRKKKARIKKKLNKKGWINKRKKEKNDEWTKKERKTLYLFLQTMHHFELQIVNLWRTYVKLTLKRQFHEFYILTTANMSFVLCLSWVYTGCVSLAAQSSDAAFWILKWCGSTAQPQLKKISPARGQFSVCCYEFFPK
jgi:hypothetical protein